MMKKTTTRGLNKTARLGAEALLVLMLGGTTSAFAQSIVVEGNRRVDSETVRSYVTGRGGDLAAARQDLIASGLFTSVNLSRQGNTVVVRVSENDLINRVAFDGNSKIKGDVLRGELQSKSGGSYNPATVEADRQRIMEIYRRSGRGLAQVTPEIVNLPNGRVDVVFRIVEGEKTGVREIRFVGNNAFSGSRLRGLMNTTEMNLLSFIKTSDVYDPDKIAADGELIRRYYLKNGYADFRLVSTDVQFDEKRGGYIVTISVDEGPQYRVGSVQVDSRVPDIDAARLQKQIESTSGSVYSADAVEKTLQGMTNEASRRGYAFTQVRPEGSRDPSTRQINLTYVVEEGPRVYVERINVRGNTRTKDYVIRREFDLGEGDAYNKVLVDRAERRLNNLGFFKKVRITNEPGSTPDRVVINVDVEDQPTGQFSISGGYSTSDGFISELAVQESNFMGTGQFVRIGGQIGQRTNGVDFSFTEPYFLDRRIAAGFDLFSKYNDNTQYARYESRTTGGTLRLGLPITEEFGLGLRYSLYQTNFKIPDTFRKPYNDCNPTNPGYLDAYGLNCLQNGEASVALKEAAGNTMTSLVGYSLVYNTLDNTKDPRSGWYAEVKQDFAGLGGDSKFIRTTGEARYYKEVWEDVVGIAKIQGGNITGYGGGDLRIVDQFFLGPSLVRGFAPSGIGPRDVSPGIDSRTAALGATSYYGASLEVQFPIWGMPRELGLKGALFADAGSAFGYKGAKFFDLNHDGAYTCTAAVTTQSECVTVRDKNIIRSSVGASILWSSPLGPIRFDYAFALSKDDGYFDPIVGAKVGGDRTQAFRFSGGARF